MKNVKDARKIKGQIDNVRIAHSFFILSALELSKIPLSIPEIAREISRLTKGEINLQDQQTRVPTQTLAKRGLLREVSTYYGRRKITKYEITPVGLRYLKAIKEFLGALEL
jgi:DNA-binding PadR family transcriptional regulator